MRRGPQSEANAAHRQAHVKKLFDEGLNASTIVARTGIHKGTILRWMREFRKEPIARAA